MKKFLKVIIIILIFCSMINIFNGCMNEKNKDKEILTILIEDVKESDDEFINTIIDEYKKENKNVNVKIEITKNIDESNKMLSSNRFDLIFCPRNSMIEFSRKGLLKNIGSIYDSANVNSRFYNIVCSYGRYNNTYYGIGLMPYSLSLLTNKKSIESLMSNNEVLNLNNIVNIVTKYNKHIPVVMPKNMSISLALGSFIGNNLIVDNKIEEKFSDDKLKYKNINEVQDSFKFIDFVVKNLKNNEVSFIEADKKIIDEVKNGKSPVILTTTLALKNITEDSNLKVISSVLNNNYKISPVVIIDHNLCAFQDGKNEKQINTFLDFICKDDIYIKLAKKGYMSGNVKGITYIEGAQRDLIWTISLANENNIPFYLNLPNKMKKEVIEELNNIMNGKYDNQEWIRIINKSL